MTTQFQVVHRRCSRALQTPVVTACHLNIGQAALVHSEASHTWMHTIASDKLSFLFHRWKCPMWKKWEDALWKYKKQNRKEKNMSNIFEWCYSLALEKSCHIWEKWFMQMHVMLQAKNCKNRIIRILSISMHKNLNSCGTIKYY